MSSAEKSILHSAARARLFCLRNVPFHMQREMITSAEAALADDAFELYEKKENALIWDIA